MKEKYYKIGQVAILTGVSQARIRLLEASYNLIDSRRTKGGFRLYSDQDIQKICSLKKKLELGWTLQAAAEQLKNDTNDKIEIPFLTPGEQAVKNEMANNATGPIPLGQAQELSQALENLNNLSARLNSLLKTVSPFEAEELLQKNNSFQHLSLVPQGQPYNSPPFSLEQLIDLFDPQQNLGDLLERTLDYLNTRLKPSLAYIYLIDESDEYIDRVCQRTTIDIANDPKRHRMGYGISGRVAVTGEPIFVSNVSVDPRISTITVRENRLGGGAIIPIKTASKMYGVFNFCFPDVHHFTEEERHYFIKMGSLVGWAVESFLLKEQTLAFQNSYNHNFYEMIDRVNRWHYQWLARFGRELNKGVTDPLQRLSRGGNTGEFQIQPRDIKAILAHTRRLHNLIPFDPVNFNQIGSFETFLKQEISQWISEDKYLLKTISWSDNLPEEISYFLRQTISEMLQHWLQAYPCRMLNLILSQRGGYLTIHLDFLFTQSSLFELKTNDWKWFKEEVVKHNLWGCDLHWEKNYTDQNNMEYDLRITLRLPSYWDIIKKSDNYIRVVVVERQNLFRQSLVRILSNDKQLKVVAELESGHELNEVCHQFLPEVVWLDLTVTEPDAIKSLSKLKKEFPNIKVVLSAMHENDLRILEGIRAGALGSILKTSLPEEFINAVHTVHNSRYLLSPGIAGKLLSTVVDIDDSQDERERLRQLSNREQLVLRELVKGSTTKKISQDLDISIKTVNQYVSALFRKLHVSDRVQLVLYAVKNNLNV